MSTNVTAAPLSGTVGMPLGEGWEATWIGLGYPTWSFSAFCDMRT